MCFFFCYSGYTSKVEYIPSYQNISKELHAFSNKRNVFCFLNRLGLAVFFRFFEGIQYHNKVSAKTNRILLSSKLFSNKMLIDGISNPLLALFIRAFKQNELSNSTSVSSKLDQTRSFELCSHKKTRNKAYYELALLFKFFRQFCSFFSTEFVR